MQMKGSIVALVVLLCGITEFPGAEATFVDMLNGLFGCYPGWLGEPPATVMAIDRCEAKKPAAWPCYLTCALRETGVITNKRDITPYDMACHFNALFTPTPEGKRSYNRLFRHAFLCLQAWQDEPTAEFTTTYDNATTCVSDQVFYDCMLQVKCTNM